jgi:hypothetical protein
MKGLSSWSPKAVFIQSLSDPQRCAGTPWYGPTSSCRPVRTDNGCQLKPCPPSDDSRYDDQPMRPQGRSLSRNAVARSGA